MITGRPKLNGYNEIALLRSDLYSGTKSQQSDRSAEEVGANDGRDDFDGKDASLPETNRKDDVPKLMQ